MTREEFFELCLNIYETQPDYPFENDFETAVFRHRENRKWYALSMRVPRSKFGVQTNEAVDVVNLKLPLELFGFYDSSKGVYPAYHMNKLHWVSVLLPDASDDLIRFLTKMSFEATKEKKKRRKEREE